ncbi:TATA box-binding protein-associated factor RNA polymerase I subunit A isoform X2 [Lingula anatina]|uniref:TATA box-binding protein-associated factor RNA polymerase I subunit A isoform X2 n=1 Tax=Lingula anatina TaxID=7574 RepID=A0A1S3ICH9_LINAN|nr:TATA box-binding protein-associated factor RNA polymerase I subunit A isoform X2 [Lingula anatina]|eukprot:XP_013395947.1 TATA box-binding protein-associated factor RNA polymerase I subunit A isoform X2 [Lingula anatina]
MVCVQLAAQHYGQGASTFEQLLKVTGPLLHDFLLRLDMELDDDDFDVDLSIAVISYLVSKDRSESDFTPWMEEAKEQIYNAGLKKDFSHSAPVVPGLLRLLKDCLLTHRWEDALRVVQSVTKEHSGTASAIWKGGSEILYADGESNSHLLELLVNQLKNLTSEYNYKGVILEYVFYLLHQGRTAEALEQMKFKSITRGLKKTPTDQSRYLDLQYTLYQGMVYYTLWLQAKQYMEKLKEQEDGDPLLHASALTWDEEYLQSHATRAIEAFRNVETQYGVWDIFVTKYVELLEFTEKTEDAYQVLKVYRDHHDENPNAHKMLYKFMKRQNANRGDKLKVLQDYVKLVPSDELVLELCDLLEENATDAEGDLIRKVLQLLFNMLDYACWQNFEPPWKKLETLLEKLGKDDIPSVEKVWSPRHDWWPAYHFTSSVIQTADQNLLVCKMKLAHLLLGAGNTFGEEAKKSLNEENLRHMEEFVCHRQNLGVVFHKK